MENHKRGKGRTVEECIVNGGFIGVQFRRAYLYESKEESVDVGRSYWIENMDVKNGAYMCNLRFVDGKRPERDGVLLGDILRDREIKG